MKDLPTLLSKFLNQKGHRLLCYDLPLQQGNIVAFKEKKQGNIVSMPNGARANFFPTLYNNSPSYVYRPNNSRVASVAILLQMGIWNTYKTFFYSYSFRPKKSHFLYLG